MPFHRTRSQSQQFCDFFGVLTLANQIGNANFGGSEIDVFGKNVFRQMGNDFVQVGIDNARAGPCVGVDITFAQLFDVRENKPCLITENLVDAVWLIDAESLKFEYITPSISKISGYRADETIGVSVLERLAPESARRVIAMFTDIKTADQDSGQDSRSMELELKKKTVKRAGPRSGRNKSTSPAACKKSWVLRAIFQPARTPK